MVVESAENFMVSVHEHDSAQGEAHDQQCKGLQTVEIAQASSSRGKKVDYRSEAAEGSKLFTVGVPGFEKYFA
jgi:hypothetical protein